METSINNDARRLNNWIEYPYRDKIANEHVMKSIDRVLLELKRLQDFEKAVTNGSMAGHRSVRAGRSHSSIP